MRAFNGRPGRPGAGGILDGLGVALVLAGVLVLAAILASGDPATIAGQPATGADGSATGAHGSATGVLGREPGGLVGPVATALAPVQPGAMADEPGVAATQLHIPRLGLDIAVVEGDGVSVPLRAAAHYPGTAWPGAGSNVYLYAHARQGLFRELWRLMDGDRLLLDLVDGRQAAYEVTDIVPLASWDALEYLAPTATEQLTLQTCLSYDEKAPRFIVISRPVQAPA